MKQKILDALTTKFAGVDVKILDRVAARLAKTVKTDEEVEPAVEGVTFQEILTSYGDARAAEASKTSVSNYEKKHGLKDGKPAGQTEDPDDDDDNADDDDEGEEVVKGKPKAKKSAKEKNESEFAKLLKAMNAKLDAQAEEIKTLKRDGVKKTRKALIDDAIKGLSDIQKKAYLRTPVDDLSDEDFDTLIGEINEEVEQLSREGEARGASFGAPFGGANHGTGGSGKKATDAEINEIVSGMNL